MPKPNPPEPGYANKLQSWVFTPMKLAIIEMFESSGMFDHCSVMLPYPSSVNLDNYFPQIQLHTPGGDTEGHTINNKMLNVNLEIYYYAKHLQDQGYAEAEINHFIENGIYLIEKQKALNLTIGGKTICLWLKGVQNTDIDYYVDGSYLVSLGMITVVVAVPVCLMQPLDEEDEE